MKHRFLTWHILVKMAAVLIIITLLNFLFAHIFLNDYMQNYMHEQTERKKDLIVQLVRENGDRLLLMEQLLKENDEIKGIAIFEQKTEKIVAGKGTYVEKFTSSKFDDSLGDEKVRTFIEPLDEKYSVLITASLDKHASLQMRVIVVDIVVTITGFILVFLTLWIIARKELKPLGEIETFLAKFSEGHFSKRLTFDPKSPFYWLAKNINEMVEKIDQLIHQVKRNADYQIEYMAYHDDLTSLPNRRKFRELIADAIAQNLPFAVLYVDLDEFKTINDTLGHAYGDKLLIQITNRLQKVIGKDGILARLGGDEFTAMIPLPDGNIRRVENICARMIESFNQNFEIDGDQLSLSLSIGVAIFPKDGKSHDVLLRNADAAMYEAKRLGKRKYVFYLPHMSEQMLEQIELEKHLRNALKNNELFLHYQPQINAKTGKIVGVEVLLRWQHKQFGMVPPAKFIPIIEKSNLINEVGEWVLRTACLQNKKWQEEGMEKFSISVNVSARQFQQANLVEQVKKILEETGLEPQYLTIEITESTAMENIRESFEKMTALKQLGVRIAIDDFGTGHSSLRYLKSFPLDLLKIDRTFIHDLAFEKNGKEIVKAIISLAHNLKIGLVAEGVEQKKQLEFLMLNNCHIIQGFLFSRPLPEHEFVRWFREKKFLQAMASANEV